MKKLALILMVAGLAAAPNVLAGGWYAGYQSGYRHGGHHYAPYRHHYRPHYRHYGHRRHDHYGALAAGLVFGGLLHAVTRPPVVERRVVYRRPVRRTYETYETYEPQTTPAIRGVPAPAQRPPYYYRKDPDGSCFLIETAEDGSEIITPQAPEECG